MRTARVCEPWSLPRIQTAAAMVTRMVTRQARGGVSWEACLKVCLGAALKRRKMDDERELLSNAFGSKGAGRSSADGDGGDGDEMLELTAEELAERCLEVSLSESLQTVPSG